MLDTIDQPETNCLPEPRKYGVAQCLHRMTPGHRCGAPAMRGEYYCFHHINGARIDRNATTPFEMPPVTDRESLRAAVVEIASRVAANFLDVRRAGVLLYSLQIALSTFPHQPRPKSEAGCEPPKVEDTSPEAGLVGAERARAVLARLAREDEARRAGQKAAQIIGVEVDSMQVSSLAQPEAQSAAPAMLTDDELDEMEKAYILPDLNAAALQPCPSNLEPQTSLIMEATMRIKSASLLCAAMPLLGGAFAATPLSSQTAKPAAPAHSAASHATATANHAAAHAAPGGCVKLPEGISPRIPAVPPAAPCPKALFTVTVPPPASLTYASPLEPDIAKELGLEPTSFTLAYVDTKLGTGALAEPHKFYTVKYTGYLPDGSVFDASSKHPETADGFSFPIGGHQVIRGWDYGFAGMHVGGKRRLFIPFPLAYGAQGQPPTIPAHTDLIFDMELVSQSDSAPAPKAPPAPPAAETPKPAAPATPPPAATAPASAPATAPASSAAPETRGLKPPTPTQNNTPKPQ